jgi:hypothetical protein
MDMPWERCEVAWGNTSQHLPWSCTQGGSSTTHAHTRANWAAALDGRQKVQEIAARDLGGAPSDYEIGGERVYRRGNRSQGMSFARVAERAIALGGRYDGHELPEDINGMTATSATALAGQGLMGVAKDNYGGRGGVYTFVAGAVCGWIATPDFTRIGLLAGLALLAFGVFTQIVYWDVLPLWYHLAAVAFIVPVAMAGANLITRRRNTTTSSQST